MEISKRWGDIDFSGYHTGYETAAILQNKSVSYPQITKLVSIGTTWKGRDIWALKISDNPGLEERDEPEVYINAQHHAREWMTSEVVLYMIDFLTSQYPADPRAKYLVENRQMWFIPLVNFDGRVQDSATDDPTSYYKGCNGDTGGAGWRKNMRDNDNSGGFNCGDGVDMNRNYPFDYGGSGSSGDPNSQTYRGPEAYSEPETRAIRDTLLTKHWFRNSITYHTYGQIVYYVSSSGMNSAADAYGNQVASLITNRAGSSQNGYTPTRSSGGSGQENGAEHNNYQTMSMLIELYPHSTDSMPAGHNGFHPPVSKILPVAEDNFDAQLWVLEAAANTFYEANYANDRGVWGLFPFHRAGDNVSAGNYSVEAAVENYGTAPSQPDVKLEVYHRPGPTGAWNKEAEQTKTVAKQLAQNETGLVAFDYDFDKNGSFRLVSATQGADDQPWNDAQNVTFSVHGAGGGNKTPPTVVANAPGNGQTGVPVNAKVSVTFSKPMNSTATEPAFSISPAIAGSFSWPTQSELLFAPSSPLAQSTVYTVAVSTAAKDFDGLNLQSPHSFTFTTETPPPPPAPQVVATVPLNGATNVAISTTIQLTFSKDMDTASVQSSYSLSPPIASAMSGSGKSFTWTSAQPLARSTQFTATILGSVKDTQGIAMGSDFSFAFTTESGSAPTPPRVIKVDPADGTRDWPGKKGVDVEFSVAMDRMSTEGAFSLSPSVTGALSWDATSTVLTFSSSAALSPGVPFVVKVEASAKDATGTALGASFTSSFEAGIPPSISSIVPSDGSVLVPVATTVVIEFSESMATSTVEAALDVRPSIQFDASWNPAGTILTIVPRSALAEGTLYTVEIAEIATDVAGNLISGPFTAGFVTTKASAGQPFGGLSPLLLAILLAALVAVVAVLFLLARRRKKKSLEVATMPP